MQLQCSHSNVTIQFKVQCVGFYLFKINKLTDEERLERNQ